jgi:hypothetical protein
LERFGLAILNVVHHAGHSPQADFDRRT